MSALGRKRRTNRCQAIVRLVDCQLAWTRKSFPQYTLNTVNPDPEWDARKPPFGPNSSDTQTPWCLPSSHKQRLHCLWVAEMRVASF